MDEGINNILLDELFEAHAIFENIISELKEKDLYYPYDKVINLEKCSYNISFNAIGKMTESIEKYNLLCEENEEFFSDERKIIFKYLLLYMFSIIIIKVFAKTLSTEKINEIWYAFLGLGLGSVNAGIISKNVNNYRNGDKDRRILMNDLIELREKYDENFEIAKREISYIFSLNHNLQEDLSENKVYVKK